MKVVTAHQQQLSDISTVTVGELEGSFSTNLKEFVVYQTKQIFFTVLEVTKI